MTKLRFLPLNSPALAAIFALLAPLALAFSPASYASDTASTSTATEATAEATATESTPETTTDTTTTAKANSNKKAGASIEEILADRQFTQGEVVRQIRTHTIDTWRYLDKYHIYIDGIGKNNNYLVKFHHTCREARGGESLLYKTHNGNLTKFDTIKIVDNLGGHSLQPHRSCSIKEIYRLDRIENDSDIKTDNTEQAESDDASVQPAIMAS